VPEEHVEVKEPAGGTGGFGMSGYGPSRFDEMNSFGSNYTTPGWQRAQSRKGSGGFSEDGKPRYVPDGVFDDDTDDHVQDSGGAERRSASPSPSRDGSTGSAGRGSFKKGPLTIEGELVAKSTGAVSTFSAGDRVFHQKFGNGNVVTVDGNKLTIHFDRAGEKRVVDSFVERV
jgi:DNA helicase-2/ATP-dependent DNA helicase PcrA